MADRLRIVQLCAPVLFLALTGLGIGPSRCAEQGAVAAVKEHELPLPQLRRLLARDLHEAEHHRLQGEGKRPEALRELEQALAIEREVFGDESETVAQRLAAVAVFHGQDNASAAAQALQEAERIRIKVLGATHPATLETRKMIDLMERLARLDADGQHRLRSSQRLSEQITSLLDEGKTAQALQCTDECLGVLQAVLGDEDRYYGVMLILFGYVYQRVGNDERAAAAFRQADGILRKAWGERHEFQEPALGGLADSLGRSAANALGQRDFSSARKLCEEALAVRVRLRGEKHPQVTDSSLALKYVSEIERLTEEQRGKLARAGKLTDSAVALNNQGKFQEALAPAREALAIREEILGREHPESLTTRNLLGNAHHGQADYVEALRCYQATLEAEVGVHGTDHPRFAVVLGNLTGTLKALTNQPWRISDFPTVRTAAQRALDLCRKHLGEQHWRTSDARLTLAQLDVLERLTREQQSEIRDLSEVDKQLQAMRQQRKHAEAIELAQRAAGTVARLVGRDNATYASKLFAVVNEMQAAGADPARRRELMREVVAVRTHVYGAEHPETAAALCQLAANLSFPRDFADADKLLREAREVLGKTKGANTWEYAEVLRRLANLHQGTGSYVEAEKYRRETLNITRNLAGETHPQFDACLKDLAVLCRLKGDYAEAERLFTELLKLRKTTKGEHHQDCGDALNSLGFLAIARGDFDQAIPLLEQAMAIHKATLGEASLPYTNQIQNLVDAYRLKGDQVRTDEMLQAYLENRKKVLGESSLQYAAVLAGLGAYLSSGRPSSFYLSTAASPQDMDRAETLLRRSLNLRRELVGEDHPDYAESLHGLAVLHRLRGEYQQAATLFQQALDIRRRKLGTTHLEFINTVNSLGVVYREIGDFVQAEPLRRLHLQGVRQAVGEHHPMFALTLSNMAELHRTTGDYVRAEQFQIQALQVIRRSLGDQHSRYLACLGQLAALNVHMARYDQAELLIHQTCRLGRQVHGTKSPEYAGALLELARFYNARGQFTQALEPAQESLRIRERQGNDNAEHASVLRVLGAAQLGTGQLAAAEACFLQSLEIGKRLYGENHPQLAADHASLGAVFWGRDQLGEAEAMYRRSLELSQRQLSLTADIQSERQQLAMAAVVRKQLDAYLSLIVQSGRDASEAYRQLLLWKGAVFVRQQRQRLARAAADEETAGLFKQSQAVTNHLAALAYHVPEAANLAAWRKELQTLTEEKERIEGLLSRRSAGFRQQQERRRVTPEEVRAALPPDAALVDFCEYTQITPPRDGRGASREECRLLAFLLRPDRPLALCDLGPSAEINQAVAQWRGTLLRARPVTDEQDPARILRRLIWQPLEPHLDAAQTVLVSPDGVLNDLPFGALPGKAAGKYLIEERALAVLPVPQILPDLMARAGTSPPDHTAPSMLLLGGIDYGTEPGKPTPPSLAQAGATRPRPRVGVLRNWKALAATRGEILGIEDSFRKSVPGGRATVLSGTRATENAVREEAPQYRYLHLATHGFFAPLELKSALAGQNRASPQASEPTEAEELVGFHPGLLSGVVLAGANTSANQGGDDDGVLTAIEVAELDLRRAELVVLSACDTGRGRVAGGEGVLGLQRAFQVAGAKTIVTSLWEVEDRATRSLMEAFYENFWVRQKGMLESLRESQLLMLHEGRTRGLVRLDEDRTTEGSTGLPPYYWAAFVLSGDWR